MMITLLKRELNNFLGSLMGSIVVTVFLVITGLFLWVFPGSYNMPESGYASMQGFFSLAPFIFLFIIPAITMRFFADEFRLGTIEMLVTKPLTDTQIIIAKWLAGALLVMVTLIPTLIYVVTLSYFAFPPGLDTGGIMGSYVGLLLLGVTFVAIGLFASSLTDNQIVSFVLAFFVSGFLFIGFEMMHVLGLTGQEALFIRGLGIQDHYLSLSRGVIDSRDLVYFFSVISIFLLLTKLRIESRKWGGKVPVSVTSGGPTQSLKRRHLGYLAAAFMVLLVVNIAASYKFVRIDLTSEKRYTLTKASRNLLRELDDRVYVRVYLEGDFPAGFRRLRNQTREMLDEFRAYSDLVQYEFVNPAKTGDSQQVQQYYDMLVSKGIQPAQIQVRADDATSQQLIFPGAILRYRDVEVSVQLLQDQIGLSIEEVLNNSGQLLEYSLISAIRQLITEEKPVIAFLSGQGEPPPDRLADATMSLRQYYEVSHVRLDDGLEALRDVRTLIIAKPFDPFSETDKFILDQFVMYGGSILWLVDPVFASMDSLQYPSRETMGVAWPLNIDDMLFRYGVRLNPNLLLDLQAAPIPVTTGSVGGRPQISLVPWPFFPLLTPASNHPVVRSINLVRAEFISSIDTIEVPGIRKTFLLETSPYTRTVSTPAIIDLRMMQEAADERLYRGPAMPVAVLLEGNFESLFRNRINPGVDLPPDRLFRESGLFASMIVVADGDLILNQVSNTGQPFPLGYDRYSGENFGNKDFIINAVNYLTDDRGIMEARSREVRLRMLDVNSLKQNRFAVQMVNVAMPVLLVVIIALLLVIYRRWRYTRAVSADKPEL